MKALLLILIISAFFRLVNLDTLPISLSGDEVDVGYQAWSLGTTGKDYFGNNLPTYIHSFSEWRTPLLMYVVAPFVTIFGPSAFSVRLPIALLGISNILLLYLLGKKLFPKTSIGIFSALLLSLTPWHLHYSRAAFEATLLLSLILLSVYAFLNKKYFIFAICSALTFYTYSTAIVFLPLLTISLLYFYRNQTVFKSLIRPFCLLLILLSPMIYQVVWGHASGRFSLISIFNDQKQIESIILLRTQAWISNPSLEPIFHNKLISWTTAFSSNYLQAFSPKFLFISGDPNFR
ncbi:MAG: glycosyltransferase family 39 protein, partial [Patescibacteria group bacterium]